MNDEIQVSKEQKKVPWWVLPLIIIATLLLFPVLLRIAIISKEVFGLIV